MSQWLGYCLRNRGSRSSVHLFDCTYLTPNIQKLNYFLSSCAWQQLREKGKPCWRLIKLVCCPPPHFLMILASQKSSSHAASLSERLKHWSCKPKYLTSLSSKYGFLNEIRCFISFSGETNHTRYIRRRFFKTVVSGVSYCIPVWGGCTAPLFNRLEEIHTKAATLIHDVPRDRDYTHVLQKANWLHYHTCIKKLY